MIFYYEGGLAAHRRDDDWREASLLIYAEQRRADGPDGRRYRGLDRPGSSGGQPGDGVLQVAEMPWDHEMAEVDYFEAVWEQVWSQLTGDELRDARSFAG